MSYIEEAIKKAGYEYCGYDDHSAPIYHLGDGSNYQFANELFLNPEFWQFLGCAMGWDNERDIEEFIEKHYGELPKRPQWESMWIMFIHCLAIGETPESFFRKLLSPKTTPRPSL